MCALQSGIEPQFSHMQVPSWRCSLKYMHNGGGQPQELKQVKCMYFAPSQGPELAASAVGGALGSANVGGGVGGGKQEGLSWH